MNCTGEVLSQYTFCGALPKFYFRSITQDLKMRRLTLQDNLASYLNIQLKISNTSFCERVPEHNHCWPEVDPDILIELPCPNEPIHHHRYMTKYCNTTGHWEPANYTQCFNCEKRTNSLKKTVN